jgi:hypothetical protein
MGRLSDATRCARLAQSLVAVGALCCGALQARELEGVTMPNTVTVDGKELRLNGMGVGKKLFLKIYVVGFYVEKPTIDAQAAINTDEARRMELSMLRDVSRDAFVKAVEQGMMRNSGAAMPTLRARLDLLERSLPALRKADAVDFTYLPGMGTLMRCQGKELTIPGKDFADALFSVWLGPRASSPELRRQLLGGSADASTQRDLLHNLNAEAFQRHNSTRVIRQQPDRMEPQV